MSASAQETKQSQDLSVELNPVVVTGTGTHHRLKDTPTPVEVVTANDIKKAGITDFRDCFGSVAVFLYQLNGRLPYAKRTVEQVCAYTY